MSDAPRCDQCKAFRPIADKYAAGDHVGECRSGAAGFRGIAHQGEGFLSLWGHVRAHWDCAAFEAAEGVQPFAQSRDQPADDPDARDFPLPTPPTPPGIPAIATQIERTAPTPEKQTFGRPNASSPENTTANVTEPGAGESPTDAPTPPAAAVVTALPPNGNTPSQAEEPTASTPTEAAPGPAVGSNQATTTTSSAAAVATPNAKTDRPVMKGKTR